MRTGSFVLVPQIKATRVYMGIDNRGMESIAIDFTCTPDFELITNKISSRIVSISDTQRLFISLVDDDSTTKEIFETFSKDIISSIEVASTEMEVLSIIANRFKLVFSKILSVSSNLSKVIIIVKFNLQVLS